jgi:hypothetical protein
MTQFNFITLITIPVLLSACGGDTTSLPTINTPATTTTTLNSFSVVGSGATVAGKIPINAGINNGEFFIAWDVDSSDPYHVDVHLNDSDSLIDAIKIFEQNCGALSVLFNCNETANFDCRFDSSNHISCDTITAFNPEKDLTSFLDTLPKSAFIIIEACNALLDNCKTSAVEIELQ